MKKIEAVIDPAALDAVKSYLADSVFFIIHLSLIRFATPSPTFIPSFRSLRRSLISALMVLSLSAIELNAYILKDPQMIASDPGITGKMVFGHCLPYAVALGDALLKRSGIYSQGITVALDNPVTHKHLGTHIFVTYLDRQGQRWVVDNNRLRPTRAFGNDPLNWTLAVLHRPEMTAADLHILFVTPLPASKPRDKARFAKWLAWYRTPDYQKTTVREQQEQQQLGKLTPLR
jgi:hypothetical protein